MSRIHYQVQLGSWSASSTDEPRTECIAIETMRMTSSAGDRCCVSAYGPAGSAGGGLAGMATQAAGALGGLGGGGEEGFSVQIRGNTIKHGDPIAIELGVGDVSAKVMTAEVTSVQSTLGQTHITGRTGMQKLACTRINQVYQNQSLSQVVNDLADQAGVETGEIDTGQTYPYLVVHESRSVLEHLRSLAMREGMDFYFDTDNKLTLKASDASGPSHTFRYGRDILELQLLRHQAGSDHVRVCGESPASSQGTDAWHWVAKDISPFQGEGGEGSRTLALQDRALRTKDAADRLAQSKLAATQSRATCGWLKVLGNPNVKLADVVVVEQAERPELNGRFKVTSVKHVLSKQAGYVTHVGLAGPVVAGALGGGLGGLI